MNTSSKPLLFAPWAKLAASFTATTLGLFAGVFAVRAQPPEAGPTQDRAGHRRAYDDRPHGRD